MAADRIAELDEGFVEHALSSIVVVLDEEALRRRVGDGEDDDVRQVDKAARFPRARAQAGGLR